MPVNRHRHRNLAMHRPHIAIILLALLAAACSKKEGDLLRLAEPVPRGVVQRTAPLIFVFSGGVVPPESTNQWTGMPYVQFTPDIPGTFTWRDSATLVFSPDGALAGDTKYRAKLNAGLLLKLSGKKAFGGAEEVV